MITKDQLAASLTRECDICIHLATKLGPEAYDYRPTPAQRSTLELLRYLAVCGMAGIESLATGDWQRFATRMERVAAMTPEEFPAAMVRQKAEIEAWFAATPTETLATQMVKMPGGDALPLGVAIMNGPLKWLAAYKMQLFLYAKATGASEIGTTNAWAGRDRAA